jgi:glycosyltransferase involved in cell wall biosynthesis
MPVYNGKQHVEEAVQSILKQTLCDFEFIIVDDGSTDGTDEILKDIATKDERVHLYCQENKGPSAARNHGMKLAQGKYIACMDADDVTLSKRFEQQVNFLNANPDVGIVGTQVEILNAQGDITTRWSFPTHPYAIAWQLLFNPCLAQPSIMVRRSLIQELGGYALWSSYAEDYELYTRALLISKLANLPNALHRLRRWDGSITKRHSERQKIIAGKAATVLHRILLGKDVEESFVHFLVRMQGESVEQAAEKTGVKDFQRVAIYLRRLYSAFTHYFNYQETSVRARQRALFQLDQLSCKIQEKEGWGIGALDKLRSRFMVPSQVTPYLIKSLTAKL